MFTEVFIVGFKEGLRDEVIDIDVFIEEAKKVMRVIESEVFNVLIKF
ncbi:hypothetical protein CaldiYA01_00670 [Caldicellulosiruptor diazotrophicus]|uniref:Uncharacterized protein n=1 Tax=Caldicellulosiruptor diazotrophicus TaxID=2806205 RepID=A0ABN6E4J3_9FIRM|nr:hypothetical protein CaldiYA01_00670 [Caldicellulosiruptor diazotrophicus]